MRLNTKGHLGWGMVFVVILGAAAIWHGIIITHGGTLRGTGGGSWPGLVWGSVALGCMGFAAMLGLRKWPLFRFFQRRSARWWLRGHLWLGLLTVPLIYFHAGGLHFGGYLTQALTWLLLAVVISGIVGALIQHLLAGAVTLRIGNDNAKEAIPQPNKKRQGTAAVRIATTHVQREFPRVLLELREQAKKLVERWRTEDESAGQLNNSSRKRNAVLASAAAPDTQSVNPDTALEESPLDDMNHVYTFLDDWARPFIHRGSYRARRNPLYDAVSAGRIFEHTKETLKDAGARERLGELEKLCNNRRDMIAQERVQWWMDSWLVIHVPLSYLLIALSILHAIWASQYMRR